MSRVIADFPNDVPYLSNSEVRKLQQAQRDLQTTLWPEERIEAYLGDNVLKRRAAVSGFLWGRYSEHPAMSLEELKLWAEVEPLDEYLRGIPAWFREQHPVETETAWNTWLAPRRKDYESRHQTLMNEILLMQRKE